MACQYRPKPRPRTAFVAAVERSDVECLHVALTDTARAGNRGE
jgi:hypothetical protein